MIKKILLLGFVVLLIASAGLLIGYRMFVTGASGFDEWVMRQVLGVAQTYLVPEIEFDGFNFTAPSTVTYSGVRLIAPDGTMVVDARELVVTLGKLPKRGEAVVIEGVTIRDGSLHLIADPDNPDITFKGLAPFVISNNIKAQESLPKEVRLSDTLELHSISLDNASVHYEPGAGKLPMHLDGLSLSMTIDSSESGGEIWHRLDFNVDRGELFQLAVDGRFNLDSLAADFTDLVLRVDVGSDSVATLPSQIQRLLEQHEAQGIIEIKINGQVAFREWRQSQIDGEILIDGFRMAIGKYNLPIDEGELPIHIGNGEAVLGPGDLVFLSGVFRPTARIDFNKESMPLVAEWRINQLDLQELMRSASPDGGGPKYSGLLSSTGSASLELTTLPDSIDGQGEVHITEGSLGNLPGLKGLVNLFDSVNPIKKNTDPTDKFDAVFQLNGHAVNVESAELETRTILARGRGEVRYNSTLDLRINAGPFKKAESILGGVGRVLGRISDQLVEYHLTGTIDEPKVAIRPFGL